MLKMLFVFNPYSGKATIKNKLLDIINIFTKAGYEVTAYPTQRALDGYDKVCESDGKYDLIVCSGGDGTLNEVISAMMHHRKGKVPLGYIPTGSTNDFAKTLGIPNNMIAAAELISKKRICSCDIGIMNGRFFTYIAAFGAFTDVSYKTPQNVKNVFGHQAYILESIISFTKIKPYALTIKCNDVVIKGNYWYGMIANSNSVGGINGITGDDVEVNDGYFEVALVKEAANAVELQQIVAGLFSKNHSSPMVDRFKTNKIIIESEEAIAWTLDGEYGDEHQYVEISILPKAVDILVGDPELEMTGQDSDDF